LRIGIIGNGIIGLTTALEILKIDTSIPLTIFGEEKPTSSASLAAAAMLNNYAELETGQLQNSIHAQRFAHSRLAAQLWKNNLESLAKSDMEVLSFGFGTNLIANSFSEDIESQNFDYIKSVLELFNEPHFLVDPREVKGLNPLREGRTSRALFINNEGWIEPTSYLSLLQNKLKAQDNVIFIHENIKDIYQTNGSQIELQTNSERTLVFDSVLIANGASSQKFLSKIGLTPENPKIYYGNGSTIRLKYDSLNQNSVIRTPNRGLACGLYSAPYSSTNLVIGATSHVSESGNLFPTLEDVRSLLDMAQRELNQDIGKANLIEIRTGWRPVSSDGVALIGSVPLTNAFLCTGTRRDGWHLSPLISKLLAESILRKKVDDELSIYNPCRKTYRFYSVEESIQMATKHYMSGMYQHGLVSPRGGYLEHTERNYESYFRNLHEFMGFEDYGIPIDLIGLASQYFAQEKKLSI
jgi:glycine/D-amino acid oxidase-like deaminating enzyme